MSLSTRKNLNKVGSASQPSSDDLTTKAESIVQFERKLNRFLHKIESQVEEKLKTPSEECRTSVETALEKFREFTLKYASLEDRIRMLMVKIKEELELNRELWMRCNVENKAAVQEDEAKCFYGLDAMKRAHKEEMQISETLAG